MSKSNQTDISQNRSDSTGSNGGFLVSAFLLVALLLFPTQPAISASSYIVTETVEIFEYDLHEPEAPAEPASAAYGQYGPFRVIAADTVEMTGTRRQLHTGIIPPDDETFPGNQAD